MLRRLSVLSFSCLLLFSACSQDTQSAKQEPTQPKLELLEPTAFNTKMQEVPGVLIDIRTASEQKKGIIPGAQLLDFFSDSFEATLNKMDKTKTYYIYCASGGRSSEASELMIKNGFTHVVDLDGGIKRWKESNLPIEVKN